MATVKIENWVKLALWDTLLFILDKNRPQTEEAHSLLFSFLVDITWPLYFSATFHVA